MLSLLSLLDSPLAFIEISDQIDSPPYVKLSSVAAAAGVDLFCHRSLLWSTSLRLNCLFAYLTTSLSAINIVGLSG